MNIPKAYIGGFQKAVKSPRMLFILYASNIFMALLLALPFMKFMNNSLGNSKLLENVLQGFDFTVFSNLMFYHADGIAVIIGSIKWLLLAFFILSIFLTGGIIRTLNKEKFTTSQFFAGAAYNFFRFLGLNIIVIFVQIIFALLVYVPMVLIINNLGQDAGYTELSYYYVVISAFVLHLLIFLLISMIGDYAKFYLVLNDSFNIFKGFWKGVRYVFKNFLKTYFLYLFLLFIPAVIMYVYLYFEKDIKMATGVGILIVFAMQQAFVFLRNFLRVWILSSEFKMYAEDFIQSSVVQDIVFSVVDTKTSAEEKVIKEEPKKTDTKKTTTKETPEKSNYAIDFSKTFVNDGDDEKEKVLTEEEMLKKVESEEADSNESDKVEKNTNPLVEEPVSETNKEESEPVTETKKEESEPVTEENEDDDDDDDHHDMIEHVYQNVIGDESRIEGEIKTEDESELAEDTKTDKEKEKKSNDDMIEFEL